MFFYISKYVLIFHEIRCVLSFSFMPPQFTFFNNRDSKINPICKYEFRVCDRLLSVQKSWEKLTSELLNM